MKFKKMFKKQFDVKMNAEINRYLLLQRMITLIQKLKKNVTNYFRKTENFVKHFSKSVETIEYNVMKDMTNKNKKNKINFECNKKRDFFLKKIKMIIQKAYQTVDSTNSFDSE